MDIPFGRFQQLRILRFGPPGAFLALDEQDERDVILLPGPEIPEGATEGDVLNVFFYRDSEDRPIATLIQPKIALGEVAFLDVKDITGIGAFFDWGLAKDLLVPFAEQTRELSVGERHPIGLFVDNSGRLAGTMRVTEMLRNPPALAVGDWVEGEAWRKESEIGVFVIIARKHVALVPREEPTRLTRGESARFRVARILADGKCVLSLRGLAHDERTSDAERIVNYLREHADQVVSESDSPEVIQRRFALSKKAFKRAVGLLLRDRRIELDGDRLRLVS
jgi:uncharacterized protein